MRRITRAALLIAGCAGSASTLLVSGASAQGTPSKGVTHGQSWSPLQDLSTSQRMSPAQGSGSAADRAARAARQAQFNQHFPGTPIGRPAAR